MSDFALQRKNMVESQIRPSDVTDRRIIRAMQAVPRELFVPEGAREHAYMDDAIPLSAGPRQACGARSLMSPRTFAKLVVLAEIEETDRVLIVGSGCGYSAAVIAEIARSVLGLDSDPALIAAARASLSRAAMTSAAKIDFLEGALAAGASGRGPFDVIVIEGAVPDTPQGLIDQLAPGGRCVAILETGGVGRATRWRRVGDHIAAADMFEASAPPLPGFAKARSFAL